MCDCFEVFGVVGCVVVEDFEVDFFSNVLEYVVV